MREERGKLGEGTCVEDQVKTLVLYCALDELTPVIDTFQCTRTCIQLPLLAIALPLPVFYILTFTRKLLNVLFSYIYISMRQTSFFS